MVRFILALSAALAIAAPAIAQQDNTRPEDRGPHLSIFTSAFFKNVPHEADLVRAFATDPNLQRIRTQCHWHHYTPNDPLYKARFAKDVPLDRFPAIVLQRADGAYIYKATGSNVPSSPRDIFDEMAHYASLDPLKSPRDSVDSRPFSSWQKISQSGLDGVPDRDGPPPTDCPDGLCPPQGGPNLGPLLPDSAELLGGRQPVRKAASVVVLAVGGIVGLFILGVFGILFLAVLYFVLRAIKLF